MEQVCEPGGFLVVKGLVGQEDVFDLLVMFDCEPVEVLEGGDDV